MKLVHMKENGIIIHRPLYLLYEENSDEELDH